MARESWTDERLDELNHRVDEGFSETREEFRAIRREMREEFRSVREEIAATNRIIAQAAVGGLVTMTVGFVGVIATVLTHG